MSARCRLKLHLLNARSMYVVNRRTRIATVSLFCTLTKILKGSVLKPTQIFSEEWPNKIQRYIPFNGLLECVLVFVFRLTELILIDAPTQTQHVWYVCLGRLNRLHSNVTSRCLNQGSYETFESIIQEPSRTLLEERTLFKNISRNSEN